MGGRIKMERRGRIKFLITLQCQWKKKCEDFDPCAPLAPLYVLRRDISIVTLPSGLFFRFIKRPRVSTHHFSFPHQSFCPRFKNTIKIISESSFQSLLLDTRTAIYCSFTRLCVLELYLFGSLCWTFSRNISDLN